MPKFSLQAAAVAALLLAAGSANALMIDDFGDDQELQVNPGSTNSDVTNPPGTYLGTNRNAAISNAAGRMNLDINTVTAGALDVSNSTTSNGTAVITWTGIGGADLTDAGAAEGLFLGIPFAIDNPMTITFSVDGSTYFRNFPDGAVGDNFFFDFDDFTDPAVFTSVDTIVMTLTSSELGWDAGVEFVETRPNPVPVPGTLALLGLGLVGLGARRSKRV